MFISLSLLILSIFGLSSYIFHNSNIHIFNDWPWVARDGLIVTQAGFAAPSQLLICFFLLPYLSVPLQWSPGLYPMEEENLWSI